MLLIKVWLLILFYKVDGYEEKIESLEKEVEDQREEITRLKSTIEGLAK